MGNAVFSSRKGKPAPSSVTTKAFGRRGFFFAARITHWMSALEIRGVSHGRNRTRSILVLVSAVKTPPSGPQRATMSRRITRTGTPVAMAACLTCASMVLGPKRSRALLRPILVLSPPARMQISIFGGF